MGHGCDRVKKQSKNDEIGLRSTLKHKFGARTPIGAPRKTRDGPIRSSDETRARRTPSGHRSDLPLFGEGVGAGGNQVAGNGPGD